MLKRFLVLPDHAAEAMALWIVHAWTIEHAEISPLLSILSPTKQCGKTTVLTLIFYLTPRSVLASNISPAALLRYVEQEKPTLIIDEADTFAIDDEALRGVLNSGHNRATAQVIRCDGPNLQPRTYSTFAPKVLAAIGQLPATVMDRSLIIEMRRKRKTESVERLRARDNTEFAELRSALQRWSEDHGPYLQDCEPAVPDHLDNRPADNRRPLLAIADQAGNSWPELARSAALALSGGVEDSDRGVELLADIRRLLHEESRERFGAEELVNRLIGIEEAPWREWRSDGRGITSRGISVLLKPFGIKSQKRRTGRFYERAEFAEAWDSYLPILPTFPP
jgi:putative DNA primase/helicase